MQTSLQQQPVLNTQPTVINCLSQPNYLIKPNSGHILSTSNVKSVNSQVYCCSNQIRASVEEMTESTNKDMLIQ
jgi:hypothetical protein